MSQVMVLGKADDTVGLIRLISCTEVT